MKRKTKPRPQPRTSADDLRPPPERVPSPPGANARSPLSSGVEADAQKLIHQAGSPSLAKEAVDQAAERECVPDFRQDLFAQRFGFAARREMLAASKPLAGNSGQSWWATAVAGQKWIVWAEGDMSAEDKFPTLEAAQAWVEHRDSDDRRSRAQSE